MPTKRRKDTPAQTKAKAYLRWLAHSKYAYHLDDSPYDIDTFTRAQAKVLKAKTAHAFKALGVEKAWEYYGKQCQKSGVLPK